MPDCRSESERLPMCASLTGGRYPSHVRELQASRYPLAMYEAGLADNCSAFGQGGSLLLDDLASGVSYRESRRPDLAAESVVVRVLAPVGGWLSADLLDGLAAAADDLGAGLVHLTTGGTIEVYCARENVVPLVERLNDLGLDAGSTGDGLRGIAACCGPARCDCAVVDATAIATYLGQRFMDEQQYPGFPHKCKTAVAGCMNDCIRATAQKDHSFVGVYRDLPQVDPERLADWVAGGGDLAGLVAACPAGAIRAGAAGEVARAAASSATVTVDGERCRRCMVCINQCPAFRPGRETGVALVVGGKYGLRGTGGAMPGQVLIPFIPVAGDDYALVGDLFERFLDIWSEHAVTKERIGDFVARFGVLRIRQAMGLTPEGGC